MYKQSRPNSHIHLERIVYNNCWTPTTDVFTCSIPFYLLAKKLLMFLMIEIPFTNVTSFISCSNPSPPEAQVYRNTLGFD